MKAITLKSARSFRTKGLFLKFGEIKNVDDALAEALVDLGFCVYAEAPAEMEETVDIGTIVSEAVPKSKPDSAPAEESEAEKPVKKMNKSELLAYAEAKGYDVSDCIRVEEIRSKIIELDEFVTLVDGNNKK